MIMVIIIMIIIIIIIMIITIIMIIIIIIIIIILIMQQNFLKRRGIVVLQVDYLATLALQKIQIQNNGFSNISTYFKNFHLQE